MSGRHARPGLITRGRLLAAAAVTVVSLAAAGPALASAAAPGSPGVSLTPLETWQGANLLVPAAPGVPAAPRTYVVHHGDVLSAISARYLGAADRWPGLYERNKAVIGPDPNVLEPGESLVLATAPVPRSLTVSVTHTGSHPSLHYSGGLGGTLSCAGLEALWERADGPAYMAALMASIAMLESGGRQYAYNSSGASGYWQINGEVIAGDVFDPMVNAENAVAKWRASGTAPWTTAYAAEADPAC